MRRSMLFVLLLATAASAQEKDLEGGQDHPLLTRMPGYFISSYEVREWDSLDSAYASGPDAKWEGKTTRIGYTVQPGGRQVSMVQIARNYEAAAKKIGGKILYNQGNITCARIEKAGAKIWLEVGAYNEGANYSVTIVEAKGLEQGSACSRRT